MGGDRWYRECCCMLYGGLGGWNEIVEYSRVLLPISKSGRRTFSELKFGGLTHMHVKWTRMQ